jgi:glycerol-3-phosphate acyltransferase PlsY
MVMATHRANIGRLLAGTEPRVGRKTPATIAP